MFVFTLPIMQADMVKSDSIQPQANYVKFTEEEVQSRPPQINTYTEDFKGYTILAVDDEPANLQVIMNVFAQEPCQIITAQHGEQALHILADNPHIDLIILDVMMPGLSGYEICRWIRERYNLFELPILLVTVKNDLEDLTSGFAAGANDFLVKPFYTHELKARAETLIKLKKTVEQAIQAETSFLRAQIKPHFLYNAMNTIVSICPRDPKKAVELLTELSHYLRANFDFDNTEKLVSFDKELELIESYLFIEKARFAERLQVVYELESDLQFFLPPLSIQPLVENAVRHGLMSKLEGGTVTIRVRSDEHYAIVFIEDDGIGMSEQKQRELFLEGHVEQGIGLKNIQMRMKRMFGYGLDIEVS